VWSSAALDSNLQHLAGVEEPSPIRTARKVIAWGCVNPGPNGQGPSKTYCLFNNPGSDQVFFSRSSACSEVLPLTRAFAGEVLNGYVFKSGGHQLTVRGLERRGPAAAPFGLLPTCPEHGFGSRANGWRFCRGVRGSTPAGEL